MKKGFGLLLDEHSYPQTPPILKIISRGGRVFFKPVLNGVGGGGGESSNDRKAKHRTSPNIL